MLYFKKMLLLFACFILFSFNGTISGLLQKAEEASASFREMEAIGYYKQVLQMDSNHFEALWKTSFVYQRLGWLEQNTDMKRELLNHAISYAKKLYSKHPGTYEANLVMAGGLARMSEFLSAKEKVHSSREIMAYANKAMSLNPEDHQVWYLLGWLNFELGKASWMERSLAGLLFGGLPDGVSIDKGIDYMEKANELKPDCMVYLYDLATFYERKEDTTTAIRLTRKALALHPSDPEDFLYKKKLENLLSRLNS